MSIAADPAVDPGARAPLVTGAHSAADVTESVAGIVEGRTPRWWWIAIAISSTVAGAGIVAIVYLISAGVGVWGLNQPVGWAWDITNFVFWIGIGHAGTLISAILFLLRQKWRTSINRAAEAMTLFAVACAGIFPLIHVGRIWRMYFVAPVPNHLDIWPNFRSPLLWDVFAVSTYGLVSLIFWYVGLVPDLATMRDRAKGRIRQVLYGFFALGWRGGQRHWRNYEMAYLILAALSTPLVLSVHSIVSFDFAVSQLPGWHTTIFPPYFVVGAIFSGFAMVLTLLIPARAAFGLHDLITPRHLDNMCKVILATACIVGYAYGVEFFTAWYSGNPFESFVFFSSRATGPFAWAYWMMVFCNVAAPQLFWLKRFRRSPLAIFVIAILINVGMWFERFVIIVTSLSRDALPSSWDTFSPTWVEMLTLAGTFGIFLTLFLLFIRFLPMIAISEVKHVMPHRPEDDPVEETPAQAEPHGEPAAVMAEYRGPEDLKRAARAAREAGYRRFDVHSPYPVHGMDDAMGLKRSKVGWYALAGGVTGVATALTMQFFPSVELYPTITAGKPHATWPLWIPITFELGILFCALATVLGMFRLNRLPEWYHPTLKHERFLKTSDDRFVLVIDATDIQFTPKGAAGFLERTGGRNVVALEG